MYEDVRYETSHLGVVYFCENELGPYKSASESVKMT